MANKWVKLEGLSELKDALEELPKSTRASVLRNILKDAGEPMAIDASIQAPRRTGRLKLSIGVSTKLSKRQRSLNKKESQVEVYVGAGPLAQATQQEFGNSHNKPQPFMRPAWDRGKQKALGRIAQLLSVEIEKARARLAKKTAKYLK
jgi:HK97 gp10 family phage protein